MNRKGYNIPNKIPDEYCLIYRGLDVAGIDREALANEVRGTYGSHQTLAQHLEVG